MQALIDVILPVFLVLGFGYAAVRFRAFSDEAVDSLTNFAQNFAIPCLLFSAIATLDLQEVFRPALMASFYSGAFASFLAGLLGARFLFRREWDASVAIGFSCLYSNAVLLGLPITERAYGPEALEGNFGIIAFHAPFCYAIGVTGMELARSTGGFSAGTVRKVLTAMFRNPLVIGIALGFAVNLSGLSLPVAVASALGLVVQAAIPVALFALGGSLVRYRPEGDMRTILYVCAVSLVLHPSVVWLMGMATNLDRDALRSAVMTAAMAPGFNTYMFASFYGVALRVAASSVLIATGLTILTAWGWLAVLP